MIASLISVGQELLLGDTINTNAPWIGRLLSEHGISCRKVITTGDDSQVITRALDQTLKSSELVIMTGGLGPTHDDITKTTLLDYFGDTLVRHEPTFAHIRDIFSKRNIPFSSSNHAQADVLSRAEVLFNKTGTAPGMWIEHKGRILVVLPGVPREMKYLMQHEVVPRLVLRNGGSSGYHAHYFQLTGIGESNLSDMIIGDTSHFTGDTLTLAYLPHQHGITLRVSSYASTSQLAMELAQPLIAHIRHTALEFIYSEEAGDTLEASVVRLLQKTSQTLSTAESCSGGQLAHFVTNVPGSSSVYLGGLVAYANFMKTQYLGVSEAVLAEEGAVSKKVALTMARSVAEQSGADFGLSTTGVAGPGGGTPEKPVGTVWIGFWSAERAFAVKAHLFNDRLLNKERAAVVALDLLRRHLEGIEALPFKLTLEMEE
jgi:nicotinamide-nucleotide amidase